MRRQWTAVVTGCCIACMTVVAHASPIPGPDDYFISPTITYGQRLTYHFDFPTPPVSSLGSADMLIFNSGSTSNAVASVTMELRVGGISLGSHTWSTPAAFGLFTTADSPYEGIGVLSPTIVDSALLNALFSGIEAGELVITPTFAESTGSLMLSGWFAHAATANGIVDGNSQRWEDIFPSARINGIAATAVGEPSAGMLTIVALGVLGAMRRHRSRRLGSVSPAT